MAIKTFNIDEETHRKFSEYCRGNGISMSKQIEFYMRSIVEKEPEVREEYLKKIEYLSKGPKIHIGTIDDFRKRYKIPTDDLQKD